MILSEREIEIVQMPLSTQNELPFPERIVMQFGEAESFDIGAFCYTTRAPMRRSRKHGNRPRCELLVILDTLDPSRREPVRGVIRYFSELSHSGSRRPTTVGSLANCYRLFLIYAESNGYPAALTDRSSIKKAFHSYVQNLKERVSAGSLSQRTAAHYQTGTFTVLSEMLDIDNLKDGIRFIPDSKAAQRSTQPPTEVEMERVLSLCYALFAGLSLLCIEQHSYPYGIPVPQQINSHDNKMWIFPARQWCMPPYQLAMRETLGTPMWAFDYQRGSVFTAHELQHRYTQASDRERAVAVATSTIRSANETTRNVFRINAAFTAHNAFVILFLAHTGMNWSGVASLYWSDSFEIAVERQGFRTVKFRAGGKIVSFEIQAIFMPLFKQFIKLRKYLLGNRDFEYLFISRPIDARKISCEFRLQKLPTMGTWVWSFFKVLINVDPDLKTLGARKFRAAKSDWLLRSFGPEMAAKALQTSMRTVLKSYSEGLESDQEVEMDAYFDRLSETVINRNRSIKNGIEIQLGVCSQHGTPKQIGNAPVDSDCHSLEGCLFCDKYRVHADEHDVRKLISYQYCVRQTAHLSDSQEQFDRLFGPILQRIEDLFCEIVAISPGLISRVAAEVEAGELDPFWASKFEILVNLEMIV